MARLVLPAWLQKLIAVLVGAAIYLKGTFDQMRRERAAAEEAEATVDQIHGDVTGLGDDKLNEGLKKWSKPSRE